MKTLVIDTIKNRQWEFENLACFDDERLRRIQRELHDDLSHTSWDVKNNTITLFSEESAEKESSMRRAKLFKEKGIPSHISVTIKFYNEPVIAYDSQLKRRFSDLGSSYKTIMVPLDHYNEVVSDLENVDCKIIGEDYVWQTKEAILN